MIRRARIIDNLRKLLDDEAVRHIAIIGEDSIGKSTLMRSLAEDGFFGEEKKEYTYIYRTQGEALSSLDIPTTGLVIVDTDNTYASSDWIDFYENIGSDVRSIVLSRESFSREDVYEIVLTGVSFREYAESQ